MVLLCASYTSKLFCSVTFYNCGMKIWSNYDIIKKSNLNWVYSFAQSGFSSQNRYSIPPPSSHNYKLYGLIIYTGKIVQQPLVWFFNSCWHDCSTVAGKIVQQSLARLFNSHWHDWSTGAGKIVQQSLAQLFNSHWHDWSTGAGTYLQQSLV